MVEWLRAGYIRTMAHVPHFFGNWQILLWVHWVMNVVYACEVLVMICFFAITIYHNLASHSLLTYCFYNKKRISCKKFEILYSMISTSYSVDFYHQPVGIIGYSFWSNVFYVYVWSQITATKKRETSDFHSSLHLHHLSVFIVIG